MIHILMVDMWTRGLPHVQPLLDQFEHDDVRLTLCHYGSLEGETATASTTDPRVTIRDIRSYEGREFATVLRQEQPDLLLKLTFYYPYDTAHFRWARLADIPSMYLAHGSMEYSDVGNPTALRSRLTLRRPGEVVRKVRKWVHHFNELRRVDAAWPASRGEPVRAWHAIRQSLLRGRRFWFNTPKRVADLPDVAAVYSADDSARIQTAGFPPAACHVTGYPQLDRTYRLMTDDDARLKIRESLGGSANRIVMYYTGNYPGRAGVSRDAYATYVRRIADVVLDAGPHLVVKVHPGEDADWYHRLVGDRAMVVQNEIDTFASLAAADVVLGEVTTLVPLAHFIGIPVGYLDLFGVGFASFARLADRYGIGIRDWDQLRTLLRDPGAWGRRPSAEETHAAIGPYDGNSAGRLKALVLECTRQ